MMFLCDRSGRVERINECALDVCDVGVYVFGACARVVRALIRDSPALDALF